MMKRLRLTTLTIIFVGSLTLPGYTQITNKGLRKSAIRAIIKNAETAGDLFKQLINNNVDASRIRNMTPEELFEESMYKFEKGQAKKCQYAIERSVGIDLEPPTIGSGKSSPCDALFR